MIVVPHTGEIPYVFGTFKGVSPKAAELSTIMQDYWISFVSSSDPNDDHGEKRRLLIPALNETKHFLLNILVYDDQVLCGNNMFREMG